MADTRTPAGGAGPLGSAPSTDGRALRRRGLLLAAGFGGVLACVTILARLAWIARRSRADALDDGATSFLHGFASPQLDALMNAASFLGTDASLATLAGLLALGLTRAGRRREALFVVVVLAGSILVNLAMKLLVQRARPAVSWAPVLSDFSFPSGHSMNSMAFALAVAIVTWRLLGPRWGGLAVVLGLVASTVIGASRIYLGFHYLTDVLGGFTSAVIWVAIVVGVFRVGRSWPRRGGVRSVGGG